MVKEIITDVNFLKVKSAPATKEDAQIAIDLIDTLNANLEGCVGLAANMIGVSKQVIVFLDDENKPVVMYNPKIIKSETRYEAEEGCLSLIATRMTNRYKKIKVEFLNMEFKPRIKTYTGYTAQIIQHEVDHCDGIII